MAIIFEVELIDGTYRRQGHDRIVAGTVNDYLYRLRTEGEIARWDIARTAAGKPVFLDGALVHVCPRAVGQGERYIAARES